MDHQCLGECSPVYSLDNSPVISYQDGAVVTAAFRLLYSTVFFLLLLFFSTFLLYILCICLTVFELKTPSGGGHLVYSREELLDLKTMARAGVWHHIPAKLRRSYRGCKAGTKLKAKLADKRRCFKLPIPTIIMGNVNSLTNKLDELHALNNQRIYRESLTLTISPGGLKRSKPFWTGRRRLSGVRSGRQ